MNKKTSFTFFGLSALVPIVICVATVGVTSSKDNTYSTKASGGPYELVLNSSNTPDALTDSYQDNVVADVLTTNGNNVTLSFVLAKKSGSNFVTLANHGMIYNFGTEDGRISGISEITATFTGNLTLYTSSQSLSLGNGNGANLDNGQTLSSGSSLTLKSPAKYFGIKAGDNGAGISSLRIVYSCSEPSIGFDNIVGTFTGQSGTTTYQMDFYRDGNTQKVTYSSLNLESNVTVNGTVSLNGNRVTCDINSQNYVSDIELEGTKLTFVSTTTSLPHIDFYRVYDIENFESYDGAGLGYDQANAKTATTKMRANWYADYYSGGSGSPIGGSGWSLMGGARDYMQFSANKGHNGSKCAAIKGNSNKLRYIQMKAFYGIPSIIGKGAKLSFWAAGAYSDNAFTTKSSLNASIKIFAYYNSRVTSANQGTRTEYEFTIPANSDWTEYTLSLDTTKNYYAISFYCYQTTGTTYTPIDDVKIYSVSPYAEFTPEHYPEGTFHASVKIVIYTVDLVFAFGNYKNGVVKLLGNNTDMGATGITYSASTNTFTIPTTGSYNNMSYGNVTGTYDYTNDRLTNVNCDGDLSSYISNVTAKRPTKYYNCDGNNTTLQSTFKRRFDRGSGWEVDTSNADRIAADTSHYISGTNAAKLRSFTGGPVTLNLNSDISGGVTVKNIGFWVYNPSDSDITLRLWVYKATSFGSNAEIGTVTAEANGWTYCQMGFTSAKIYNFQIANFNNSSAALTFDNIILF